MNSIAEADNELMVSGCGFRSFYAKMGALLIQEGCYLSLGAPRLMGRLD
jgi:hypothetical protein